MNDVDLAALKERPATSDGMRVSQWFDRFEEALHAGNAKTLATLFQADSHWRDLVAFTWHITPVLGADKIASAMVEAQSKVNARGFKIDPNRTPPRRVKRLGIEVIEALFEFETDFGRGNGVLRLGKDATAWVFLTTLEELKGFEEHIGVRRPTGEAYSRNFGGENWLDQRIKSQAYEDRDPTVLVVGGGQ